MSSTAFRNTGDSAGKETQDVYRVGKEAFETFCLCLQAEDNQEQLADLGMRLLGVHQGLHALFGDSSSRPSSYIKGIVKLIQKINVYARAEQHVNAEDDRLKRKVNSLFPMSTANERISTLRRSLNETFESLIEQAPSNLREGLESLHGKLGKLQSLPFLGRLHVLRTRILEGYTSVMVNSGSPMYTGQPSPNGVAVQQIQAEILAQLQTVLDSQLRSQPDTQDFASGSEENPGNGSEWDRSGIPIIAERNLKLGKCIGSGAFGEVRSASYNGTSYAVKTFKISNFDDRSRKRMISEAELHFRLRAPCVVEMKGICLPGTGNGDLWIVMELMDLPLDEFLRKYYGSMSPIFLLDIAKQIADGIQQLHALYNVLHRDLKCQNLLLKRDNSCLSGWRAKISDFGLSQEHHTISMSLMERGSVLLNTTGEKPRAGTLTTMAPETLQGHGHGRASDMFAFGVILWEMLTGSRVWQGMHTIEQFRSAVLSGCRPALETNPKPDELDEAVWIELRELISRCWAQEHNRRPSFQLVSTELGAILQKLRERHPPSDPEPMEIVDSGSVGELVSMDLSQILDVVQQIKSSQQQFPSTSSATLSVVTQSGSVRDCVMDIDEDLHVWQQRVKDCIEKLTHLLTHGDIEGKKKAVEALGVLSSTREYIEAISTPGIIRLLLELLRTGPEEVLELVLATLGNLSVKSANKVVIAENGAIPLVVDLLNNGSSDGVIEKAASLMQSLAVNSKNKGWIAERRGIDVLVGLLRSGTDRAKEIAAGALRNLAVDPSNMEAITRAGGIIPLIELLRNGTENCKKNAASALRNMAANVDNKVSIAQHGGIEALIELLKNGNDEAKEKTAGALSNLARNDDNKNAIAAAGGIEPLIDLVRNGSDGAKEKAAGALQNLALALPNADRIRSSGGVEVLTQLCSSDSTKAREKASGALRNLNRSTG